MPTIARKEISWNVGFSKKRVSLGDRRRSADKGNELSAQGCDENPI